MHIADAACGLSRRYRSLRAVAAALLALAFFPAPAAPPPQKAALVLHLDGAIGPATAYYVSRALQAAANPTAQLVILRMDTPGGLDVSMRAIIRDILASPVPVATYVSPSGARAASAGTYILYASHIAAMAPGTNVGAATPVQIGGGIPELPGGAEPKKGDKKPAPPPGGTMEAKAINDAVAYIRSLAELRGRNVDWAEKAVRESASLSATAALQQGVIDIEARDIGDLLRQMEGRTVTAAGRQVTLATANLALEHVRPDWRTRMLAAITDPNVALILMMIGVYGLIFEFMNPSSFLPGTVGAICLLLGLYAFAALPVNYAGLALMLLGIGMLISEAFLFSHGILGIGGVIAFALGAAILIDADVPDFRISWSVIAGISAASAAFILIVVRTALGSRRRRVVSGPEEMIGAHGTVQDWSGKAGHVFVHGERWTATSDAPLRKGQPVRVTKLLGLTLKVDRDPVSPAKEA
jgi:membrane-bound serine protease (ClpP class)